MQTNSTGIRNTAVGHLALGFNSSGNGNTVVGWHALDDATGSNNTAVGYWSGHLNTTGSGNVFLGYMAGYYETGSNKLYIANSSENPPLIYGDFFAGKVGLGTISPTAKLHVDGGDGKGIIGVSREGASLASAGVTGINLSTVTFGLGPGVLGESQRGPGVLGSSAEVQALFGYNNNAYAAVEGQNNGSGPGIAGRNQGTGAAFEGYATSGDLLRLSSIPGPNLQLVVTNAGSLGIGTSAPSEKLDVNGTARLRSMSTGSGTLVVADENGVLMKQSSSRHYKDDIRELPRSGDQVLRLQPVRFRWKSNGQEDIGLIAEDVEAVLSDLVTYDSDHKPDGVKYDRVAIYLLEVVKQQQERMDQQKQRIDQLEATLRSLSGSRIATDRMK